MHKHWYICDSSQDSYLLEQALRGLYPQSSIEVMPDLQHVRMTIRAGMTPASVLVGSEVLDVTPINVAAALVHDASCEEVVLAARNPSGSLRSRAARAGIARVINLNDLSIPAPGCSCGAQHTCENQPLGYGSATAPAQECPTTPGDTKPCSPLNADKNLRTGPLSFLNSFTDLDEPDSVALAPRQPHEYQEQQVPFESSMPVAAGSTKVQMQPACPVLLVASGRGGCGKTLTVAALARAAGAWGLRVAVADFDLGQGNLAATFGVNATHELASVVQNDCLSTELLEQALLPVAPNIDILGPCIAPELAEVLSPHIGTIVCELSKSHDLVLIDSSTTWTDAVAQAAQLCSRLLLIQDGRHGGTSTLARVAGLARRLGVASTRIVRVDNFVQDPTEQEPMLPHANTGLEQLHNFVIPDGQESLRSLVDEGHFLDLDLRDSLALGAWVHMLAKLLEELGALPQTPEALHARDTLPQFKPRGVFGFLRRWEHVAS